MGYPHQEYHVEEEVVTAHQRAEGFMEYERKAPRRGGNKQANKGSFAPGNKVRATAHDSRSHRTPQPNATALGSRNPPHTTAVEPPHTAADSGTAAGCDEYVVGLGGIDPQAGFDLGGTNTASGTASASSALRAAEGRAKGYRDVVTTDQNLKSLDVMARRKGTGQSQIIMEPNKPWPNRLCYPEAFKGWKPGMRVPKCKRCQENLQPNENHVCQGFVPKYPVMDMEAREDNREASRQGRMAQRRDRDIASDTFGAEGIQ
jgi:hypothetical protein